MNEIVVEHCGFHVLQNNTLPQIFSSKTSDVLFTDLQPKAYVSIEKMVDFDFSQRKKIACFLCQEAELEIDEGMLYLAR